MKKVLIVDDSEVWRSFLRNMLETKGYSVEVAKDGLDGINKFFIFLPDAVVVDYIMPKLNGVHFTRFIRSFSAFKKVGVLMLTGADETINPFWAKRSGANAFLKKTAPQDEIERAVLEFLTQPFTAEWTREVYKIHMEPFGELVDILDETLRQTTFISEILELSNYVFDEHLLLGKLYELLSEVLEFEGLYIALTNYEKMRLYGFGKGPLAEPEKVLKTLSRFLAFVPYKTFEEGYTGERDMRASYLVVEIYVRDEIIGFIVLEAPKHFETAERTLLSVNEPLGKLFSLLNEYQNLAGGHEVDEVTGLLTSTFFRSKVANAIDFAKRNGMPLTLLSVTITNLASISKELGQETCSEILRKVGTILSTYAPDMVGRLRFNEFSLVLIGANLEKATSTFERIKESVIAEINAQIPGGQRLLLEPKALEWGGETPGEFMWKLEYQKSR